VERCDAAQVGVTETVLVAYASENGSTKGIAKFIAARLIRNGLLVQAHSVVDAPDPAAFDAVVGDA
jgi:menaquinone-dependent protoporphyrinogen IX oxidase